MVEYIVTHAAQFRHDAVVIDCGGIKRGICEPCFDAAEKHGFTFIGGHPMAGLHRSGLKYADADLYEGEDMFEFDNFAIYKIGDPLPVWPAEYELEKGSERK